MLLFFKCIKNYTSEFLHVLLSLTNSIQSLHSNSFRNESLTPQTGIRQIHYFTVYCLTVCIPSTRRRSRPAYGRRRLAYSTNVTVIIPGIPEASPPWNLFLSYGRRLRDISLGRSKRGLCKQVCLPSLNWVLQLARIKINIEMIICFCEDTAIYIQDSRMNKIEWIISSSVVNLRIS